MEEATQSLETTTGTTETTTTGTTQSTTETVEAAPLPSRPLASVKNTVGPKVRVRLKSLFPGAMGTAIEIIQQDGEERWGVQLDDGRRFGFKIEDLEVITEPEAAVSNAPEEQKAAEPEAPALERPDEKSDDKRVRFSDEVDSLETEGPKPHLDRRGTPHPSQLQLATAVAEAEEADLENVEAEPAAPAPAPAAEDAKVDDGPEIGPKEPTEEDFREFMAKALQMEKRSADEVEQKTPSRAEAPPKSASPVAIAGASPQNVWERVMLGGDAPEEPVEEALNSGVQKVRQLMTNQPDPDPLFRRSIEAAEEAERLEEKAQSVDEANNPTEMGPKDADLYS